MKHQTGGTGWPSGNILDFHAGLLEVLGSNPGGEKKFVCVYLPSLSYKRYHFAVLLYIEFLCVFLFVFAFNVIHGVILLTRFCKLLTTVV